jgi:hypothetical protein
MARMHQCPRCSVGRKTDVIWVAPDENAVVTRFLFAFPSGVYTTALSLPQDSTEPPAAPAAASKPEPRPV